MANKEWELTDEDYYNIPPQIVVQDGKYDDLERVAHAAQKRLLEYINERYSDVDYFVTIPSIEWKNLLKELNVTGDNNV